MITHGYINIHNLYADIEIWIHKHIMMNVKLLFIAFFKSWNVYMCIYVSMCLCVHVCVGECGHTHVESKDNPRCRLLPPCHVGQVSGGSPLHTRLGGLGLCRCSSLDFLSPCRSAGLTGVC